MEHLFSRPPVTVLSLLVFLAMLSSCEKDIQFHLDDQPSKLVVEATIENGQAPVVFLSTSLNYFSKISPEILAQSFVHGAVVELSNGSRTHKLKEYSVPLAPGYNLYYYSIDSASPATAFVGELNKQYALRIQWQGREYQSTTTIPNITRRIDSLWWLPAVHTDSSNAIVMVRATDPAGYGDYIRYFTKKNREGFLPGMNSAYDDLFIDGTTYELQVDPGVDRNFPVKEDERFFKRGDTVVLKLSNIDKATYDFWRTMEYAYQSVGNPFSTPVKVMGNISNGALGYFGGYASQYRQLIIPH
jgi:hypothetical protein